MNKAMMDPRTMVYLAEIVIPAGLMVGSWAVGCVKQAVKDHKAKKEVKKMLKTVDEDYEELCRQFAELGGEA